MGILIFSITLPKFEEWQAFGPSALVTCKTTEKETPKCFFCEKEGKIFSVSSSEIKITERPNLEEKEAIKKIIENILKKFGEVVLGASPCCKEHVFKVENDVRSFFEKRKSEIKKIKIDGI